MGAGYKEEQGSFEGKELAGGWPTDVDLPSCWNGCWWRSGVDKETRW
jgi:hypothetical protein